MPKKIRIKNDIFVTWTLRDANLAPYDMTGRDVKVLLVGEHGAATIRDLSINGNIVSFWFRGRDQRETGKYGLALVENCCGNNMLSFDVKCAFILVGHSWETGGQDCECSGVTTETIELSSTFDTQQGPQGPRGLSAYEVAVVEGFEGTVEEWLASLAGQPGRDGRDGRDGQDGPEGPAGGLLYPTFRVNAAMHLVMSDNDAAVEDRFELAGDGHLSVKF